MEGTLPEGLRGQLLALALTVTVLVGLWIGCVQPLMDWQAARTEALARRTEYLRHMTATARAVANRPSVLMRHAEAIASRLTSSTLPHTPEPAL